jgi:hypothetical protein
MVGGAATIVSAGSSSGTTDVGRTPQHAKEEFHVYIGIGTLLVILIIVLILL